MEAALRKVRSAVLAEDAIRFNFMWNGGTIAIFALAGAAIGSTRRHNRVGPKAKTEVSRPARALTDVA
jgi:hypothetical protein